MIARGFLLGGAALVPGLSGGTVALAIGFYERLIDGLRHLQFIFLFTVAAGGLLALAILSPAIHFLLGDEGRSALLLATFCGFILGSAFLLARQVGQWRPSRSVLVVFAAALGFALSGGLLVHLPLFFAGLLAAAALLLPGISGAYLLAATGHYADGIAHLTTWSYEGLVWLSICGSGLLLGLLLFAHLIGILLARFRDTTFAILIGLMLGGLRATWPALSLGSLACAATALLAVLMLERLAYARA